MRPYRGWTKEGKWIYGWYGEDKDGKTWIYHRISSFDTSYLDVFTTVIPETVGQATGRKDKNGKESYFDDVLEDGKKDRYAVVWIKISARFALIMTKYPYTQLSAEAIPKLLIIGNIHENPIEENQ